MTITINTGQKVNSEHKFKIMQEFVKLVLVAENVKTDIQDNSVSVSFDIKTGNEPYLDVINYMAELEHYFQKYQ